MSDYTVYIDEAGDLGIGRGTQWFVLSAVIVAKEDEPSIRAKMNLIKTRLNVKEIHLRKITDFYKRGLIASELATENFTYMNVLVDTNKFDREKIPSPLIAYNFVCKYLLERVSGYLEDENKKADIVLSARGTSRDGELIEYIKEKLFPYFGNHINEHCFGKVSAKAASSWDLLQLADVCATTMFLAYEQNAFGFTTPCFSIALSNHLYRKNGRIDSYGTKFFTPSMRPDLNELRKTRVCTQKERTPGATAT